MEILIAEARQLAQVTGAPLSTVKSRLYRGLEALLKDPSLASPDPTRSRVIPKDQAEFLKAYESRQAEMIEFLKQL